MIDLMAHFGSLFAVLLYFRKDVAEILQGLIELLGRKLNKRSVLALNLILATPPALVFGAFLSFKGFDELLRAPLLIAATSIGFGLLLWWADVRFRREKTADDLTWKGAIGLGMAQALALIPGTSRSGITMTAARMMHMTRVEAARFSMLMSMPIIAAGGAFAMLKLALQEGGAAASLQSGLIVAGLSFVTAYLAIAFFMKLISRIGMFPFMLYRVALGIIIIIWVLKSGVV